MIGLSYILVCALIISFNTLVKFRDFFSVVVHYPFFAELSTGEGSLTRRHKCISYRVYRQFPHGGYNNAFESDDIDPYSTSGGETSSGDSTDEENEVHRQRQPQSQNQARTGNPVCFFIFMFELAGILKFFIDLVA